MTKSMQKFRLVFILLLLVISSCVNLKHVNDFSVASHKSIEQFEEIKYSFRQSCLDNCHHKNINELNLRAGDCNCKLDERADSVTLLMYHAAKGYLDGLTNLSNNDVSRYKIEPLTNALTEEDFGAIKLGKEQVEAYGKISTVLLRAFTDGYRKNKIKEYVIEANEPFKILISFLNFNLSENLVGKLNVQKQRIESHYFDLTRDASLSTFEKRKAVEEYYQLLGTIEARQQELLTYSKALRKIAEGHQTLADNINNKSKNEIKELLTRYANDIQDIRSEFNKLK